MSAPTGKKNFVFLLCMMAFSHSAKHCHDLYKGCVCFYIFNDAFNVHLLTVLSGGQKTEQLHLFPIQKTHCTG